MFTVIRVYGQKIEEFIAVIKDGKLVRRYSGVSEFTVNDILQTAGVDTVIGSSMPISRFKKISKAVDLIVQISDNRLNS